MVEANVPSNLLTQGATETGSNKLAEDLERQRCIQSGGKWDKKNKVCIYPVSTVGNVPVNVPDGSLTQGATETGSSRLSQNVSSGSEKDVKINLKDAIAQLDARNAQKDATNNATPLQTDDPIIKIAREQGISLRQAADIYLARQAQSPQNVLTDTTVANANLQASTEEAQTIRQQQLQRLVAAAQRGLLTPEQLNQAAGAGVDLNQALGAGLSNTLPSALGGFITSGVGSLVKGAATSAASGAATGASAGGFFTPAALALSIAGGVAGFAVTVRNNLKTQRSDSFAKDKNALSKGKTYLEALITDTNQNPQNAAKNIAAFYQTLSLIDRAHARTFKTSQEDINKFLGVDGSKDLYEFELFDTTMRQYYLSQFNAALANPDPNAILITSEDIELGV